MKIVVCAKVCDGEINIFDKSAIESALQLSEDVTVVSMGPKSTENILCELTRLGVKVVWLCDSKFAGADTISTAYILSQAIKKLDYDLIICGRQTTDGDTAQTAPMLSVKLNLPIITNVLEILSVDSMIKCRTRAGEEIENLPAIISVERINALRFPRMRSKTQPICEWNAEDIEADVSKCGLSGSPTRVVKSFENKKGKRKCTFITKDELLPLVDKLVKAERAQIEETDCDIKFDEVWAVGEIVAKEAKKIAKTVTLIKETDPVKIAQMAQEKKPKVILWNADLWGRKNAPIAAVHLNTGLCADCVKLETDGETLFMYRPARSGNIIAKIVCTTNPQMATVRCVSKASDIIVSAGRGVVNELERVRTFASEIGAEFCASRAVVDAGEMPIEAQIGLTGKSVSPKIYIAVGISGAVHHTCAIENAGTVIAINPDRDARIFEYADYGILDKF